MNMPENNAAMMKGNAEPERIDGKQQGAIGNRIAGSGQRQYRSQHRPDAWRPSECKGKAHHIGRERIGGRSLRLEPRLARQECQPEDAEKIQPHQNDDDACGDGDFLLPHAQEAADRRCACTEQHKNGRKAENKTEG